MSGFDTLRVRIADAIASHDTAALAAALRSGKHHGKPGVNAATKRWTARTIHERDGADTPELFETALRLASNREPIPRSIACILLADLWRRDREIVLARTIHLAIDPDWEVREWAAGIFGAALDRDFDLEYPTMGTLVVHPEPGVRRAVALAAMRAANAGKPERAGPLVALLERLLAGDDRRLVRQAVRTARRRLSPAQ